MIYTTYIDALFGGFCFVVQTNVCTTSVYAVILYKSFVQQLQSEQIIVESCRRLMKAGIICWNCLFLHNTINTSKSTEEVQNIIKTIKSGSIMMWRHVNFRGLYDFSEEMTRDQFSLKLDISKPLQGI